MSDFNEFFTIFYKDPHGRIKPVLNEDNGLILFVTFIRAESKAKELGEQNPQNMYVVHSVEISRELFQ